MTNDLKSRSRPPLLQARPPLLAPVAAYAVLTVLGVVLPLALSGGLTPWGSDSDLLAMYRDHGAAVRTGVLCTLGACVPLGIATAVFAARLRALGLLVPGRLIATVGGAAAAVLLAVSGLLPLAMLETSDVEVLRALQRLQSALGGTGFVVFSGLLVAGVAVPGWLGRVLPRPFALAGLAVAVVCELGALTVLTDSLSPLLPVGRFGALLWLLGAAVLLPRARPNPEI